MLSRPTTSSPRASSFCATWEPMNPAAPVTRIFMRVLSSEAAVGLAGTEHVLDVVHHVILLADLADTLRADLFELAMRDGEHDGVVRRAFLHDIADRAHAVFVPALRAIR